MAYHCNKCGSETEEGFLLEKGDAGLLSAEVWVSGMPEKHRIYGLNLKNTTIYDVKTYRCTSCGYLESFAVTKQ